MYYSGWYVPFPTGFAKTVANNGAVPLVQMDPDGINIAAHRLRAVRRLPELLRRGRARLPSPGNRELRSRDERRLVLLGLPAHISGGLRGCLAAYRQPFPRAGAQNVTWLWTVNIMNDSRSGKIADDPAQWWPGSSYVTWVGIDGYYLKPNWQFAPLFGPTIGTVRSADQRPDPHRRDGRRAGRGPASEDHRPVRRHPLLRSARIRVVQLHELHRPVFRHQQPGGDRRVS